MRITVLCKVIDNFGDIGVVFRLCRAMSELRADVKITLVIQGLETFKKIEPEINESISFQIFRGWSVFDWNAEEICKKEFSSNPPEIILECFQCGRPDWLEDILFSKDFTSFVQIVNIEYLTAESWAEDFHLLKSGTRSLYIKKTNFLPGFTKKTGGLILDSSFMRCIEEKEYALHLVQKNMGKSFLPNDFDKAFKILIFSYPHDFTFLSKALKKISFTQKTLVFIAGGKGFESARTSFEKEGVDFIKLPFMAQETWDAFLTLMDFSFVRGEDSFSRLCLLGKPFVWNIYPQDEEFHLVKLEAFLKLLNIEKVKRFSLLYNIRPSKEIGKDAFSVLEEEGFITSGRFNIEKDKIEEELENLFLELLSDLPSFEEGFTYFAKKILKNGNLAENLFRFLDMAIP